MKRVFSKKVSKVTKSIRMTKEMATALKRLANENGETLNSFMVLALESYLQDAMKRGEIKPPKDA